MANKDKTKQTNTTRKMTKIFVWVMLFSMVGTIVIGTIIKLIAF
ncbi:DUF4044 domain-containing protein [Carnobacterium funditum]|nr:DUF4044 domain-containing protein [Carnobacterium funditum]